jgi:tetratricopeptide (TPR) repeat protein
LLLFTGFNLWKSAPDIAFELNEWGFDSKNLVNAELYYRLALIFDPKMPEPSYNLGLLYEDQNKFNQAEAAYKRAIKQGWVDAYNNLARLYILQKQSLKAVSLLEKELPSASENKTKYAMLKNLGWANMELGRYEEAQTYLKKAMTVPSMRPSAYCLNIQLLELQQLKQQALPDLHKCLNLEPKTPEEYEWRNQAQKILATLQQNTKSKNTGIE